ncbi:MAG: TetR/AcrR family transcriptional regulator [Synergistaceae bacterium]|nr:TetR/AcrR family transcriptional regulator [Synergistaceae bacterium]
MTDKERLIHAAIEEIKIRSLRFTMEDLTRRLRVSKTSLYKVVASKDEVISEVINELINSFNRKESEILSGDKNILEKLRVFTQSFMELTQGFDSSMYGDLRRFYESEWEKWISFRQDKINVFMSLLQQGINEGVLRPVNSAVFYQCISASMTAIASPEFLENNNLTYSQAVDTLQDIVFHGIIA